MMIQALSDIDQVRSILRAGVGEGIPFKGYAGFRGLDRKIVLTSKPESRTGDIAPHLPRFISDRIDKSRGLSEN
jgi:hypothetical protein